MTSTGLTDEYMAECRRRQAEGEPLPQLEPPGGVGEDPGWFGPGMPEGAGALLAAMFGPPADQPSSGPPYTHVHRLPETEEEIAAAPWPPITHTITRDGE